MDILRRKRGKMIAPKAVDTPRRASRLERKDAEDKKIREDKILTRSRKVKGRTMRSRYLQRYLSSSHQSLVKSSHDSASEHRALTTDTFPSATTIWSRGARPSAKSSESSSASNLPTLHSSVSLYRGDSRCNQPQESRGTVSYQGTLIEPSLLTSIEASPKHELLSTLHKNHRLHQSCSGPSNESIDPECILPRKSPPLSSPSSSLMTMNDTLHPHQGAGMMCKVEVLVPSSHPSTDIPLRRFRRGQGLRRGGLEGRSSSDRANESFLRSPRK